MNLCSLDGPVLADLDLAVLCASVHKTSFPAPWSVESFSGLLKMENVTVILLEGEPNQVGTSQNLDPRRLVRQTAFCDPQILRYSAVLENDFPASQQRLEVFRGTQVVGLLFSQVLVDEAEILTFCVAPQFRRQGWGLKMLTRLCDDLRRKKVYAVFLEVAMENDGARGFYKAFGFQSIAKRKNYYSKKGRHYDADVMKIILSL